MNHGQSRLRFTAALIVLLASLHPFPAKAPTSYPRLIPFRCGGHRRQV